MLGSILGSSFALRSKLQSPPIVFVDQAEKAVIGSCCRIRIVDDAPSAFGQSRHAIELDEIVFFGRVVVVKADNEVLAGVFPLLSECLGKVVAHAIAVLDEWLSTSCITVWAKGCSVCGFEVASPS